MDTTSFLKNNLIHSLYIWIFCRYKCIENDLLGSMHWRTPNIAPYKSKGVNKASELVVCTDMKSSSTEMNSGKDGM